MDAIDRSYYGEGVNIVSVKTGRMFLMLEGICVLDSGVNISI